ncbi:MAG: ABC transporter ATP-binding protein [Andreesenia angusta]|nr:ABC transporter ATP-binding protein [Andreesenia angusta]
MVIQVDGLVKKYGDYTALKDISYSVERGETLCVIGSNGSGKTSLIECTEGLRDINYGDITVLGLDPFKDRRKLYNRIGVQLQEQVFASEAKVEEICRLYSSFYDNPVPYKELLDRFDLLDRRKYHATNLSSGQKKKLSFILAMLPNPEIVFLDEITSFLDPGSRKDMVKYILGLKELGTTIINVTHHMDEAELLSDRIIFMKEGRIIENDSVENIIGRTTLPRIVKFHSLVPESVLQPLVESRFVDDISCKNHHYVIRGEMDNIYQTVKDFLIENDIKFDSLYTRDPNLEDFYLYASGYEGVY